MEETIIRVFEPRIRLHYWFSYDHIFFFYLLSRKNFRVGVAKAHDAPVRKFFGVAGGLHGPPMDKGKTWVAQSRKFFIIVRYVSKKVRRTSSLHL